MLLTYRPNSAIPWATRNEHSNPHRLRLYCSAMCSNKFSGFASYPPHTTSPLVHHLQMAIYQQYQHLGSVGVEGPGLQCANLAVFKPPRFCSRFHANPFFFRFTVSLSLVFVLSPFSRRISASRVACVALLHVVGYTGRNDQK